MDACNKNIILHLKINLSDENNAELLLSDNIINCEIINYELSTKDVAVSTKSLFNFLSKEHPHIVLIQADFTEVLNITSINTIIKNISNSYLCIAFPIEFTESLTDKLLEYGFDDICTEIHNINDVEFKVKRLIHQQLNNDVSISDIKIKLGLKNIIGSSEEFKKELEKIPLFSACDSTVLINGDTGTGKELIARAVHYLSDRNDGPFVAINCATIPQELADNELFGHDKGAYTNASEKQIGLIKLADNGTLFLDEIDSLPVSVQAKILRFLQEQEIRPLGSMKVVKTNVRIIASTNAELKKEIESGDFRKDLFYRLNVLNINIPSLHKRGNDIIELANYFKAEFSEKYNKKIIGFSSEAKQQLLSYSWPGNVRELRNLVEAGVLFSKQSLITASNLGFGNNDNTDISSFKSAKEKIINDFEIKYISDLLSVFNGNVSEAARAAHKNRRAFWELMKKHNINVDLYRNSTAN